MTVGSRRRAGDPARSAESREKRTTPLLEWVVGGLGAVLVGGAIAFLFHHALMRDRSPPDLIVTSEQVVRTQQGYLVRFRAANEGRSAAAQVTIEGEFTGPDGSVEVSDVVLDYLPPHSDREGGLLFTQDPRDGALRLRATGYARP